MKKNVPFANYYPVSLFCVVLAISIGTFYIFQKSEILKEIKNLNQKIESIPNNSTSKILDENHQTLSFLGDDLNIYLNILELDPLILNSIIDSEDKKFFQNSGTDFGAIFREFKNFLLSGKVKSGASTISTQLVKIILNHKNRSYTNKIKEFIYAIYLNTKFSKDHLLDSYINSIYLGHKTYGLQAASYRYFGKNFSKLNQKEKFSILALIKSPSKNNPIYSKKNHKTITHKFIKSINSKNIIDKNQLVQLINLPLNYHFQKNYNPKYGYFIDYIKSKMKKNKLLLLKGKIKNNLKIVTTYNIKFHKKVQKEVDQYGPNLESLKLQLLDQGLNSQIEIAFLWINSNTGSIEVMMGGKNYQKSSYNRSIYSQRSPGSSLKPIIYSLALKNGYQLTTPVLNFPYQSLNYQPKSAFSAQNYSSLVEAIIQSNNNVALNLGRQLGISSFIELAKEFGIQSPLKKEMGTIIGGSEVTLLDLARMYSVINNGGKKIEIEGIKRIYQGEDLIFKSNHFKPKPKILNSQILFTLEHSLRLVSQWGTGKSSLAKDYNYKGKTGTSNNSRDNWFCGIYGKYVGILWIGPDKGRGFKSKKINAANVALPLWLNIIKTLDKFPNSKTIPEGISFAKLPLKLTNKTSKTLVLPTISSSLKQNHEKNGNLYRRVLF